MPLTAAQAESVINRSTTALNGWQGVFVYLFFYTFESVLSMQRQARAGFWQHFSNMI